MGRNFKKNGNYHNQKAYAGAGPKPQKSNPPNTVIVRSESFTREYDVTLSLGRETNRKEIADLIVESGAVHSYEQLFENVHTIGINNRALENGQVVIVCKNTDIVDVMVEKLNDLPDKGIRSCHSYNDVETAVKFNWVHPRASIPIDVVQKILKPHGEVISHTAVKDQTMPVYTFFIFNPYAGK